MATATGRRGRAAGGRVRARARVKGPGPAATVGMTTGRTLREQTVGVRLAFQQPGVRRTLRKDQIRRAQAVFAAADGALSARKRLFNTAHPAWRAVSQARRRIRDFWRSNTLPYPESATRLLRREWVEPFEKRMGELRTDLLDAVERLDAIYPELLGEARGALGELYEHDDYPADLAAEFGVTWDYPSLEPPDYLAKLKPELYAAEAARVAARFDEALVMAEQALAAELASLVDGLVKQLAPAADGRPREVKPQAVGRLRDFIGRFREMNVHGSAELDRVVEHADQVLAGQAGGGETTRDRNAMARGFAQVRKQLAGLVQERPRRKVVRGGKDGNAEAGQAPQPRDTGLFATGESGQPEDDNREDAEDAEEGGV